MKIADVVSQLLAVLPRYTDLFSDNISISSLIRNGNIITATTTTNHELIDNDFVYISGAITPITISTLTRTGNVAKAITASNHDLTTGYQTTVEISGADQTEYNGIKTFIKEDNRKTFYFQVAGTPTTPATGTIRLFEDIKAGYNGWHQITIVDDKTFNYTITSAPESPALGNNIICKKNFRISGAISVDRAKESYTKQQNNKLWLFVVSGGSFGSKDRYTFNDSTKTIAMGQDYRSKIIEPFSLFVFSPTTSTISGLYQRDQMEDVAKYIYKSILRLYIPSGFADTTQFQIVFVRHGIFSYEYAYYIHEFAFENQYDLVYEDTIDDDDSVAFRDLRLKFGSYFDPNSGIIMNTNVDLDNIPL